MASSASIAGRTRRRGRAAAAAITNPSTRPARRDEREEDEETTCCPICLDSLVSSRPGGRLLRSSWTAERFWLDCGHAFCQPCLSTYAAKAVEEGKTAAAVATGKGGGALECPVDGCTKQIFDATLKQLLSKEDWAKHVRLVKDTQVAVDPHLRHCPKPDCDGAARLSAADLALLTAPTPGCFSIRRAGVYVEAACGACGHRFCAKCSAPPHPKDTCEGAGDAGFLRWKQTRAVQPCPSCGYQTEKRGGCSHMCCAKCRTHWCWGCQRLMRSCTCYGPVMPYLYAPQPVTQAAPAAGPLRYLMMAGAILLFTVGAAVAFRVSKHLGALSAVTPDAVVGFPLFLLSVLAMGAGCASVVCAVMQILHI